MVQYIYSILIHYPLQESSALNIRNHQRRSENYNQTNKYTLIIWEKRKCFHAIQCDLL